MSIAEEHAFWLGILLDHLTFIHEAIPISQKAHHQRVEKLSQQGRAIVDMLEDGQDIDLVTALALDFAEQVGVLKREFLALKLTTLFKLEMDPTVLNHMLNELEEYLTIIAEYINEGTVNPKHALHYHKLWLLDAYGHLILVKKHLDPIEKELKERVSDEKDAFHHLHMKALELIGYLRAADNFPELLEFNDKAVLETQAYLGLLSEIAEMLENNVALGSLKPELLNHMLKEQTYYLNKLALDTQDALPGPMASF